MQAALNGLNEKTWTENVIQDAKHNELGLKKIRHRRHYSSYWTAKYTIWGNLGNHENSFKEIP